MKDTHMFVQCKHTDNIHLLKEGTHTLSLLLLNKRLALFGPGLVLLGRPPVSDGSSKKVKSGLCEGAC